jgi:hypothetical protein
MGSQEIAGDGTRIQVDIYRGEDDSGWIVEVIDEMKRMPPSYGMNRSPPTRKPWRP